jgi:hypothetical protein
MRTITTTDYDDIVATVSLYIDGWNERDVEKYKSAFHPKAWMFYTGHDGVFHEMPLEEKLFRSWANRADNGDKGDNVELRILSVAQMGDAAAVALAFGDEWLDFHSLARVDGVWKITNKTACHRTRA